MINNKAEKAYGYVQSNNRKATNIVMLYNIILKELDNLKKAMESENLELKHNSYVKIVEIITGLQNALDFSEHNNLCKTLYSFYSRIYFKINDIVQGNNATSSDLDKISQEIEYMKSSWNDIASSK